MNRTLDTRILSYGLSCVCMCTSSVVRRPSSVIRRKYRAIESKLGCLHACVIRHPSSVIPESLHVAIRSVKKRLTDAYTTNTRSIFRGFPIVHGSNKDTSTRCRRVLGFKKPVEAPAASFTYTYAIVAGLLIMLPLLLIC